MAEAPNKPIHVFMVPFPGHGHINPLLRLARRLADFGLFISFCAPESACAIIRKTCSITDDDPTPYGRGMIRFEFFDDGQEGTDLEAFMARLELVGRQKLPEILRRQAEIGRPVSCMIGNPFIPWVCDVAESLGIPCAVLWVQSAACFAAYYHYYNNLVPFPTAEAPEIEVAVPCMPALKHDEFPSFLHPSSPYRFLSKAILGQFGNLSKTSCVLMETFQELEREIVEYMSEICCPIVTVGPLFKEVKRAAPPPPAIRADSCTEWLDSQRRGTVAYVSFGTIVQLKQEQVEEIAYGLLEAEVSFLWVLRPPHVLPEGFEEAVGAERGKIVGWSPQEEVLAHPSTACFVTHCGWNSTMEAVASGVPVVAFPQWGDQVTNAKFMVDVYGIGIRLCRGDTEGRIVPRDEVARVLKEAIDGPRAADLREKAVKWKRAAEAAVAEGGSSYNNLHKFVDQLVSII